MSAEAIAEILQSTKSGKALTAAINAAITEHDQPEDGFNTIVGEHELLAIALDKQKIPALLNSDIEGDLDDLQIVILARFALQQGWLEDFASCKKMEDKSIPMDGEYEGEKLLKTAVMNNQVVEFIRIAKGTVNLSTKIKSSIHFMWMHGEKATIAYYLLATGKFKDVQEDKLTGNLDLSDPYILHHIVNGRGEFQWNAVLKSDKLVGMLDDFNYMAHVVSVKAKALVHKKEPLIATLAKNNMVDKVLGHLAEKGMLANEPDVYGDGTDRGGNADKEKHHKNELDLGFRPYRDRYKIKVKFGSQEGAVEERFVTPLLMHKVNLNGPLVEDRLKADKLVFNLRGSEFKDAIDYLAKTDNPLKDMWFRVQVNYYNDKADPGQEMVEVADIMSGGPKESKHAGKLAYGCKFDKILDTAVAACKETPIADPEAGKPDIAKEGLFAKKMEISVNPFGKSTYYCLRPCKPEDAVAVDAQFLREHNVTDDMVSQLLGEG